MFLSTFLKTLLMGISRSNLNTLKSIIIMLTDLDPLTINNNANFLFNSILSIY